MRLSRLHITSYNRFLEIKMSQLSLINFLNSQAQHIYHKHE